MRRRDRPLDIFRQMRVARSNSEMLQVDENIIIGPRKLASTPSPDKPIAIVTKKKLNIPVGDVVVDPEYDTFLPANYAVPSSYVRYIVKLSDDIDLITDYICDADDEEWMLSKITNDDKYGYSEHLHLDNLEKIINALEKLTGFGDTITMNNAEKALHHVVPNVPPVVYSRLIPDIYHYWQSKRKRYNKPCCRKFWPATSVTDTNPHMVFRPREKERYRLRKHRKNDLDSYRKLQQLRREFAVAQNLMQLVIERERLKKADLAIQNDVIAQNIFEIQFPNSLVPRVEPFQQFSYQLQYPHLLKTDPPVASKKKDQPDLKLKGNRNDNDFVEKQKPGRKPGVELKRKRANQESAVLDIISPDRGVDIVTDVTAPAQFANALLTGHALYEANTARLNALGVPGPPVFLQPAWPSFMDYLPTRQMLPIHRSITEYVEELEFRQDKPLPSKFRCRGRIGRGGRVIMDRVPVYDDDPNELSRFGLNSNGITYIYPTALPSLHEQARFAQAVRDCKDAKRCIVSLDDVYTSVLVEPSQLVHHGYLGKQSGIISSSGLRSNTNPIILSNKNMDLYQSRCHPVRDLGLAFPFPRLVQPAELSRREHELYHMPDSDEESIELPEGYLNGPAFSVSGMIHESAIEGLHNATGSTGSVISYSHIKNSSSKAVNYVVDI